MPHFVIEQGNALISIEDRRDAMAIAARIGSECGFIDPSDLKVRLRDCDDFLHLDGSDSFIHLTLHLLAGRSPEQKAALTTAMRAALADRFGRVGSISIDLRDMDPDAYKKRLSAPA